MQLKCSYYGLISLDLWILELKRVIELFQDICEPYVHFIYISYSLETYTLQIYRLLFKSCVFYQKKHLFKFILLTHGGFWSVCIFSVSENQSTMCKPAAFWILKGP